MDYKNIRVLNAFDPKHIPDLDVAVLGALELFQRRCPTYRDTTSFISSSRRSFPVSSEYFKSNSLSFLAAELPETLRRPNQRYSDRP